MPNTTRDRKYRGGARLAALLACAVAVPESPAASRSSLGEPPPVVAAQPPSAAKPGASTAAQPASVPAVRAAPVAVKPEPVRASSNVAQSAVAATPPTAPAASPPARRPGPDDALRKAKLLAALQQGSVFPVDAGAPAGAHELLVTQAVAFETLRSGDRVMARAAQVAAFAVLGREPCGGRCYELLARPERRFAPAVPAADGTWRLREPDVLGRVVYVVDADSGAIRDLRGGGEGRPTTIVDEYNRWRPQFTAEELAERLSRPQRPARWRRPLVQF